MPLSQILTRMKENGELMGITQTMKLKDPSLRTYLRYQMLFDLE